MRRFKYKAKDKSGNLVTGEVDAASEQSAVKLIRQKELVVISLRPIRELPFNLGKKVGNRISTEDVNSFTRQLATMINAGLPLTESLLILRAQLTGASQKVVAQILADVEEGVPLSKAMSKHPKVFSKTYIALIKSGELGGVLDKVLARLADNLEKQQEFKGKVKGAMIYPMIIVIGLVAVAIIMLVFVIPRLTSLYDQFGADLPLPTQILIGISTFMTNYWPFVLVFFGVSVYGFKLYRATKKGRKNIDQLMLKIPLVGPLQQKILLTDFARTLSLMVGSGVSIIESLTISSEVVGNSVIADALSDSARKVEKGFPVAFAFSRHPEAFPYLLTQMIAVGEETGKMDEVLEKVSHVFEVESDQKLKAITAAIEPIILIVLGVGVAFLVISVILPIYNLTTQF
ncbi:type II secretion system F family protein [Patescibacteria group bacterium]|nr:type II secretion system F family protein [Patescibacteria group bacterium]